MSTSWRGLASLHPAPDASGKCRVAVLYEDTPARERAVWLGHHLALQLTGDLEFEFSWWRFRYLGDPQIADAAAEAASDADILIFSARADSEVPEELREFIDLWLHHRGDGAPVLVPLVEPATAEAIAASPLARLLQDTARNLGMECLLPDQLRESYLFSEPMFGLQNRAHQVTNVLDNILHNAGRPPAPPLHWGINE